MEKYSEILHLTRPFDHRHPAMTLQNRAAQFAPFDALTGFDGRIHEVSRLTDTRIELSEEAKHVINDQLCLIDAHIKEHPVITVTYFVPDKTKDGGSYQTITASAVKIDIYDERLHLCDDLSIAFDDILSIDSSFFPKDL